MTYEEIKQTADQYLMPTYAHFNAALVEGKGARLFGPEGESYLDFTAGIGVSCLGAGDCGAGREARAHVEPILQSGGCAGGEAVM